MALFYPELEHLSDRPLRIRHCGQATEAPMLMEDRRARTRGLGDGLATNRKDRHFVIVPIQAPSASAYSRVHLAADVHLLIDEMFRYRRNIITR